MLKGIDVSRHQGIINWDKVKADGIEFAMIRLGYGWEHLDEQFERNVKECERVGIKWGAYFYSYALNESEAIIEANFTIKHLKGKNPTFPIAFDMEDADKYKQKHGMPSNSKLVDICHAFLDKVENAGYYVSLYANLHWLTTKINSSKLDRFDKWVAQWANKCTYNGSHQMWQYSSSGSVKGISGRVDMNYAYTDFLFKSKEDVPKVPEKKPDYIGHPYEEKVKRVKEYGLMQGYPNGDMGLNDTITRGQMVVILDNAIEQGYFKK